MAGFTEFTEDNGKTYIKAAESKIYNLQEIIDYLEQCTEEPQYDTHVHFEIRESGDLYIITGNDKEPAEVKASGFTIAGEEEL